jgi:hypothetical protein
MAFVREVLLLCLIIEAACQPGEPGGLFYTINAALANTYVLTSSFLGQFCQDLQT